MVYKIERFIDGLIEQTKNNKLDWRAARTISDWREIRKELDDSEVVSMTDYFIDDKNSYVIKYDEGYIFLLKMRYANAMIFSPALDKYLLVVKINENVLFENLCNYDEGNLFQDQLLGLNKYIQENSFERLSMPESLYSFMNHVLNKGK